MIKFCLEQWERNKERLKKELETRTDLNICDYKTLVKLVTEFILNNPEDEPYYLEGHGELKFQTEHITEIDDGQYQGTLLYLIPFDIYQPSEFEYLMTFVDYGSCSGCDTLQGIQYYCDKVNLTPSQVDDFMALCKDIVTNMIRPYNTGWRSYPIFDTVEVTEND